MVTQLIICKQFKQTAVTQYVYMKCIKRNCLKFQISTVERADTVQSANKSTSVTKQNNLNVMFLMGFTHLTQYVNSTPIQMIRSRTGAGFTSVKISWGHEYTEWWKVINHLYNFELLVLESDYLNVLLLYSAAPHFRWKYCTILCSTESPEYNTVRVRFCKA